MSPALALAHTPSVSNPTPTTADLVFRLITRWRNACRVAFGKSSWHPLFSTKHPWASDIVGERVRWFGFCRLHAFLETHQVPTDQFCAAIAQHHARYIKRNPNPRQVASDWGIAIWQTWCTQRLAEGNGNGQGAARVQAAASLATQSPTQGFAEAIQQAYSDCRQFGPTEAPSLTWGAEVLWLFWATEPTTRPAIKRAIADAHDPAWWHAAFTALNTNIPRKLTLLRSRTALVKSAQPIF